MKLRDLQSMSVDELWSLHQSILRVLPQKLASEKSRLEQRLRQLRSPSEKPREKGARRPYPPVHPKFRNPRKPQETWSGRGKQPRWLTKYIQAGRKLDEFKIK
jgi:DNA-binding protein H-NS